MSEDWRVTRKCDGCPKLFIVKRKKQRFCTAACRLNFHHQPKMQSCPACGHAFQPIKKSVG